VFYFRASRHEKLLTLLISGFTHDIMDVLGAEAVVMQQQRIEDMLEKVRRWLFDGPFSRARELAKQM